jgi:hypothetical protein
MDTRDALLTRLSALQGVVNAQIVRIRALEQQVKSLTSLLSHRSYGSDPEKPKGPNRADSR